MDFKVLLQALQARNFTKALDPMPLWPSPGIGSVLEGRGWKTLNLTIPWAGAHNFGSIPAAL